ncbi:MAG: TonB-dependent receptor [Gemmatimonadota bacterium]|nr:TonB-dependent receptor [Gemmatimonadota bacterium]
MSSRLFSHLGFPFCAYVLASPMLLAAQEQPFSLEGLIVTVHPTRQQVREVSANVTVLEGMDLRAKGIATVADALRSVAGINIARTGSFGAVTSAFMRGGESDYVLVLLDGVQINQPGGAFDFSELDLAQVERIEIVRGPASALHGGEAVAGVIHVITRTGSGPTTGSLSTRMGSYGRRDLTATIGASSERAAYSISASRMATDGIFSMNNQHVNTVVSGTARLIPDDRTRAHLSLRLGDRRYHFPTDGTGKVVDTNSFTYADGSVASLRVERAVSEIVAVEALVGITSRNGGLDDAPDDMADTLGFFGFTSLDHFRRSSANLRAHLRINDIVFTGGWEVEHERQRSFTESLSPFGTSSDQSENDRLNHAYYAHATSKHQLFTVNGGARLERNERFGTFVTWQAGTTWKPFGSDHTRLRASTGRALKTPTFFENFATGFARGNPHLDPESSTSWELGIDRTIFGGTGEIRLTWFDQSFEDLIQFTFVRQTPTDPNYFNVAAANSRGLELQFGTQWRRISGSATWSWLNTQVTDSGLEEGPGATFVRGEPLLRRPTHNANFHVAVDLNNRIDVYGNVGVTGSRSDRDFSSFPATPVELQSYAVFSVGARWETFSSTKNLSHLVFDFRMENILDVEYQEVFGFPTPGRGLYLGLSLDLGGGRS